ncbi:hypothetical protein G7Y79_00003g008610 [Physcia stellaris]|nr:hypothetical protein G7Y79_00003g008610 [Physcia stellaris]
MSYATRLASFASYPPTLQPTPYQLSASGFASKKNPDIPSHVHCMQCGIQFYGFKPDEDPYRKHCEHSPTCHWILATEKYLASKKLPKPTPKQSPTASTKTPKAEPVMAAIPTPPSTPKAELVKITTIAEPTPKAVAAEHTFIASTAETTPIATSAPIPTPPATPIATPCKQISWAEIASRPVVASKPSRLPIPAPKSAPKALETASVTRLPTPRQTSAPKHQKPYLTIEDLFEMFAGKPKRTGLLHTKKTESSPKVSNQTRITSYFRPAANQSKPISQGSKTPNPRSFQQHTPAGSNRAKSTPPTPSKWSEKSAILPYRIPTFSRQPTPEISSNSPYKSLSISRCKSSICPPLSPTPRASLNFSGSRHACRICSGTFGSNNGLHRHLRATHFNQEPRHG